MREALPNQMPDSTMQLMNSDMPALSVLDGIELVDGNIQCHVEHQGKYTDIGSKEEADLLHELQRQPWRDVVKQHFAEKQNWLYRIITEPSRTKMLDRLALPEGGRFLDVGSGWGQLTIPLARRGSVYALDQTISRLRILREIAHQEGVQPHFLCGDIRTLPLRAGFFDLIVFNGSLEYTNIGGHGTDFESHLHVLRRVQSALAPGGRVYIGIENAVGLKYVLGAPDDHTAQKGFTYRLDREDGTAARTWSLDQYLRLFQQAGLAVETAYACFPDYKLIAHMVPLEQVNDFILTHGLPASEHSGVNGAALGLDPELRALYGNLARMGIAQNFVPSFGFVLISKEAGSLPAGDIESRSRDIAVSLLRGAGLLEEPQEIKIRLHRVAANSTPRPEHQSVRFNIHLDDLPIASLKYIPLSPLTDADAILAVYREYQAARTFRPVRLIGSQREGGHLWLLEEFVSDAVSLDDLVANGELTADEATDRIVRVVDDVFEFSPAADQTVLDRELAECEAAFRSLFDQPTLGSALFTAFRDGVLAQRDRFRTVLSTRDYIGRNLVRTAGNEWVLLDYDLARRSVLFCLDVARNFIQMPLCTNRLLTAKVFAGLDAAVVRATAVAMEFSLQRQINPSHRLEAIRSQYRLYFLREWAPAEIDALQVMQSGFDQEMRAARAYQERLESEVEKAREYQKGLEQRLRVAQTPEDKRLKRVDIMVVSYNSSRWIDGFVASLHRLDYPVDRLRLVFIDNGSKDDSLDKIKAAAATLPMRLDFVGTGRNLGFTGGYETAFRHGEGDYYFVVNLDTVIAPDAINKLVQALENDPLVGIAEARQSPREHPKYYDAITGETSWCSGACMMIRPTALRRVGGGFEKSFFMYCEDVDLSWRMWLHGWKCVYVPEAVVEHFTEDLDPKKTPKTQHYFTMRNGALLRVMYGSPWESLLHYAAMLRLAILSRNPFWHKWLTLKAMFASLLWLPSAIRGRTERGKLGRHPWVFFNGWLFGKHARDLAVKPPDARTCVADLAEIFPFARKELGRGLPVEAHLHINPCVWVSGIAHRSIVAFDSAVVRYRLAIPAHATLTGQVGAPQDTWSAEGRGRFEIHRDGQVLWQEEVDLSKVSARRWLPFEIDLEPTPEGETTELALFFHEVKSLGWGLWGNLKISVPEQDDGSDEIALRSAARPAISIVIPTHNRADQLPRVVQRLMSQDVSPDLYEVIIVDSNSADSTPQALRRLTERYSNLTALRCDRSSVAATRNMGLNVARAELIMLLDDDILVGRDLLRRVFRWSRKYPGRVLLGKIIAPWEDSVSPFERFLVEAQDVNNYVFPDSENVPSNHFYTACVAIPRSVLGATRFDEGFQGAGVEDIEFGFRLLTKDSRMVFMPDVQVQHEYYPTYLPYRRKKCRHGYWLGYFLSQHPECADRFHFEPEIVRHHRLVAALSWLTAPWAAILYFVERIRYATRPLSRGLYRWMYRDLRLKLYRGVLAFKSGKKI